VGVIIEKWLLSEENMVHVYQKASSKQAIHQTKLAKEKERFCDPVWGLKIHTVYHQNNDLLGKI